ncbi:hypothetical protein GCM10011390_06750 [Aureimonas endophytica]|uniref:Uncharacterized protein n=1 Tax=Aureimonas endophytica TaxID=2027858 RepID=A0A916ZE87_9HYPH|nr:hypothetical protein [Aureimonas endophytica]GGD90637.1 hypothetical protein GCM10011390_06750 [Aureimonas endophytica]
MPKAGVVDRELAALIRDVVAAELLAPNSPELRIAEQVATSGLGTLDGEGRRIWENRLLPILSKPLSEQIAIASILRRGGYVPRRIQM